MIEVHTNLYVGNERDFKMATNLDKWSIVQACKLPYHRDAVGYKTMAAPKESSEYLYAFRDNKLILNMIDADTPNYVPFDLFETAIQFINHHLYASRKVLVHCNQGRSRGPGIALAYLRSRTLVPADFNEAIKFFTKKYPDFWPSNGVKGALERDWDRFRAAPSLTEMKNAQRHESVDPRKAPGV